MNRLALALVALAITAGTANAANPFQKKTTPADNPPPAVTPAPKPTPAPVAAADPASDQDIPAPVKKPAKKKAQPTPANSKATAMAAKRKMDAELAKVKSIPKPPPVSAESHVYIKALNDRLDEALKQ